MSKKSTTTILLVSTVAALKRCLLHRSPALLLPITPKPNSRATAPNGRHRKFNFCHRNGLFHLNAWPYFWKPLTLQWSPEVSRGLQRSASLFLQLCPDAMLGTIQGRSSERRRLHSHKICLCQEKLVPIPPLQGSFTGQPLQLRAQPWVTRRNKGGRMHAH